MCVAIAVIPRHSLQNPILVIAVILIYMLSGRLKKMKSEGHRYRRETIVFFGGGRWKAVLLLIGSTFLYPRTAWLHYYIFSKSGNIDGLRSIFHIWYIGIFQLYAFGIFQLYAFGIFQLYAFGVFQLSASVDNKRISFLHIFFYTWNSMYYYSHLNGITFFA